MIKRYPCQAVLLFICGILAGKELAGTGRQGLLLFILSGAAAGIIWICIRREPVRPKKLRQAVLLFLAFSAGVWRMCAVSEQMGLWTADITDGQKTVIQGRIIKKQFKQTQDGNISWTVCLTDSYRKTAQGVRACGDVILYTGQKAAQPVIGNIIVASGTIQLFHEARNDGNFDARAYYQNQGYAFQVYADQNAFQVADADTDDLREFLYVLRQQLIRVYESGMPQEEAGALCAMLTGEKSLLSQETGRLYRQSGIAHILAISGLHISILGAAVFRLLRRGGISYPVSSAVSMGLLLPFGVMTGFGTSTMRAVVMFGMHLAAACCGRVTDGLTSLAVAAGWILLQNPRCLFLAGFQFSFLAVAGVLFGNEICQIYRPRYRLAETALTSLCIQMLTLPLTAWYYFEIPVYSILLNLFVLPFMSVVLLAGLAGGISGLAGSMSAAGLAVSGDLLSGLLLDGCTLLLGYFSKAGELCLRIPGAVYLTGRPQIWQIAGYYLILAGSMLAVSGRQWVQAESEAENQRRRSRQTVVPGFVICLALLLLPLSGQAEVVFLDVGQGDGIYIHTGDGQHVMIDGGSTDVKQAGTYRILPFLKSRGVAGIDYWFLSHLDQDHISGFLEAAQNGYPVREVVLAEGVVRDEAYDRMMGDLSGSGVRVRYLKKGDAMRAGQSCFRCLAPAGGQLSSDRNAQSLVLLYEDDGFRGLFSGDISKKEEQMLLAEEKLSPVTLYKAAHHGSDGSNDKELLAALKPSVSVISCAVKNAYGHPGEEASAMIELYSGITKYTMHSGQIRVTTGTDTPDVSAYLP